MQFGGQRGVIIREKRVKDLSKATPLKNRFGGQRDTDALKEKEERTGTGAMYDTDGLLIAPVPVLELMNNEERKRWVVKRKARLAEMARQISGHELCPDCEGLVYHFNNDSQLGETCSNCIEGWVIKDSDDVISTLTDEPFERGVKLGAGVAVGFSLISLGIGVAAGVLGLIYEQVTGE
jgi:hypothetical protein